MSAVENRKADTGNRIGDWDAPRQIWCIEGKFVGGCEWRSNETWASREEAAEVMERWQRESVTPSAWMRVVELKTFTQSS